MYINCFRGDEMPGNTCQSVQGVSVCVSFKSITVHWLKKLTLAAERLFNFASEVLCTILGVFRDILTATSTLFHHQNRGYNYLGRGLNVQIFIYS